MTSVFTTMMDPLKKTFPSEVILVIQAPLHSEVNYIRGCQRRDLAEPPPHMHICNDTYCTLVREKVPCSGFNTNMTKNVMDVHTCSVGWWWW